MKTVTGDLMNLNPRLTLLAPLLWLAVTLTAYALAYRLFLASGLRPIVNPVVIAAAAIIALLVATGTDYDTYFEGAQFVHFLLGPAIVALAVPLWDQARRIRRVLLPMAVGQRHGLRWQGDQGCEHWAFCAGARRAGVVLACPTVRPRVWHADPPRWTAAYAARVRSQVAA